MLKTVLNSSLKRDLHLGETEDGCDSELNNWCWNRAKCTKAPNIVGGKSRK